VWKWLKIWQNIGIGLAWTHPYWFALGMLAAMVFSISIGLMFLACAVDQLVEPAPAISFHVGPTYEYIGRDTLWLDFLGEDTNTGTVGIGIRIDGSYTIIGTMQSVPFYRDIVGRPDDWKALISQSEKAR